MDYSKLDSLVSISRIYGNNFNTWLPVEFPDTFNKNNSIIIPISIGYELYTVVYKVHIDNDKICIIPVNNSGYNNTLLLFIKRP